MTQSRVLSGKPEHMGSWKAANENSCVMKQLTIKDIELWPRAGLQEAEFKDRIAKSKGHRWEVKTRKEGQPAVQHPEHTALTDSWSASQLPGGNLKG